MSEQQQPAQHPQQAAQPTTKKIARSVTPLRKLTMQLDKQVKIVEAKKAAIAKLQKSLRDDEADLSALMSKLSAQRSQT